MSDTAKPHIIGAPLNPPALDAETAILCPYCGADRRVVGHGMEFRGLNIPGVGKLTHLLVFCPQKDCRREIAFVLLAFEPVIAPPDRDRFRI